MASEPLLSRLVRDQFLECSAEGRSGKEDMGSQTLVEMRILRRPVAVSVLDLAMRPGQLERPDHRACAVILVRQRKSCITRIGLGQRQPDHR